MHPVSQEEVREEEFDWSQVDPEVRARFRPEGPPERIACPRCGGIIQTTALYCYHCGLRLREPTEEELERRMRGYGMGSAKFDETARRRVQEEVEKLLEERGRPDYGATATAIRMTVIAAVILVLLLYGPKLYRLVAPLIAGLFR